MTNILAIPEYAKVKVYWDDKPENYSRQAKLKVRNYFSDKYGINKANVNVVYRPIKIGKNGEVIEIDGAGVDNILDKGYQVQLMKEWCKREEKDVDFKRLMDLDSKVNGSLEDQGEIKTHRSWSLKWLFIDNFLSFGEKNFVSFGGLKGLNIVNSEPANQGGKTVFTVDAIKFLLFGKTTKTDKNEQIFNTFTDKNELTVRGMLDIEGEEMIIERVLTRKAKRNGDWNVTNSVNYYRLLPDGEEELLNEEDSKRTGTVISDNIGSENDFDVTVLATGRNLEDLVDAKPTESGRLLTKFIGLEVIESKEAIAKKMYSDFNKMKNGNHYGIEALYQDINGLLGIKELIKTYEADLKTYNGELTKCEEKIKRLESEKERLLNNKLVVDVQISQLNPTNIEQEIETITAKGLAFKNKIIQLEKEIKVLIKADYDEYEFNQLEKDNTSLTIEIGGLEKEVEAIGKVIANLRDSEICQTCDRPLDDIDNSKKIEDNQTNIHTIQTSILSKSAKLKKINDKITKIKVDRELVDKRNRLELERDKAEVEIGSLRNKIVAKKDDLKKYKSNENAIKTNIDIDTDISAVNTDLVVEGETKTRSNRTIYTTETAITKANEDLTFKENMITKLEKEEEIEKIFKVYLEMIGKKGISKLVLRSVLPIINSELYRLLDEVCDFEVELEINDKNEVEYTIIKSEVSKLLKSGSGLERTVASLALRCVLSKISYLPTPNFITFDEVLGKVAVENLEKIKPMFEKIKDMFDIVFFITHNDIVKDWGDKVITITKVKDISSINLK